MKARSKLFVCCASLLTAATFAQTSYGQATTPGTESQPSGSQRMQAAGQGQQFYDAKSLIGKEAKNTQNQNLGEIKNIVLNPQTGQTFAAINVSGDRYALVPFQALTISGTGGREQVTLNATKDTLQSGPTVKRDQWQQQLSNPTFTQSIYSHYNVQPPAGSMGGAGGSMGGGTSGGTSGTTGQP